jgi:hypothetical protein
MGRSRRGGGVGQCRCCESRWIRDAVEESNARVKAAAKPPPDPTARAIGEQMRRWEAASSLDKAWSGRESREYRRTGVAGAMRPAHQAHTPFVSRHDPPDLGLGDLIAEERQLRDERIRRDRLDEEALLEGVAVRHPLAEEIGRAWRRIEKETSVQANWRFDRTQGDED